jgi:hypothetical protein
VSLNFDGLVLEADGWLFLGLVTLCKTSRLDICVGHHLELNSLDNL